MVFVISTIRSGTAGWQQLGRPDTVGWDDVDHLELATLSWVHWFNETRIHGHCGDVPPAEFEVAFYAAQQTNQPVVGIQ